MKLAYAEPIRLLHKPTVGVQHGVGGDLDKPKTSDAASGAVLHSDEEPHRIGIYINTHTIIQHICINVYSFLFLCFSRLKKTQRSHESKCKEQEEEENDAGLKDRFSWTKWVITHKKQTI